MLNKILKILDFISVAINSITLFFAVNIVRFFIYIKQYSKAKRVWSFCISYLLLDRTKFYYFFSAFKILLIFLFRLLIILFLTVLIYSFIFLILEETLSLNFFACNKALIFFFIYCFVYMMVYDDKILKEILDVDSNDSGILDYDEFDEIWDDLNYDAMEFFEVDAEEPIVDYEEDLYHEAELDDSTEFTLIAAAVADDRRYSLMDEDDLVKDDLYSNLYFHDRWMKFSRKFRLGLSSTSLGFKTHGGLSQTQAQSLAYKTFLNFNHNFNNILFTDFYNKILQDTEIRHIESEEEILKYLGELSALNSTVTDTIVTTLYLREEDLIGYTYSALRVGGIKLSNLRKNILVKPSEYELIKEKNANKLDFTRYFFGSTRVFGEYKFVYRKYQSPASVENDLFYLLYNSDSNEKLKLLYNNTLLNLQEANNIYRSSAALLNKLSESRVLEGYFNEDFVKVSDSYSLVDFLFFFGQSIEKQNKKVEEFLDLCFKLLIQSNIESEFLNSNRLFIYFKKRCLFLLLNYWSAKKIGVLRKKSFNRKKFYNDFNNFDLFHEFFESLPIYFYNYLIRNTLLSKSLVWKDKDSSYRKNLSKEHLQQYKGFGVEWNSKPYNVLRQKRKVELNKKILMKRKLRGSYNRFKNVLFLRLEFFFHHDIYYWLVLGFPFLCYKFNSRKANKQLFLIYQFLQSRFNFDTIFLERRLSRHNFFPFLLNDKLTKSDTQLIAQEVPNSIYLEGLDFVNVYCDQIFLKHFEFFHRKYFNNEITIGLNGLGINFRNNDYFKNILQVQAGKMKNLAFVYPLFDELNFKSISQYTLFNSLNWYINYWNFFDFSVGSLSLRDEELFALLMKQYWMVDHGTEDEQMYVEVFDTAIGGVGGSLILEEQTGEVLTDSFDINWDWTLLNWNKLQTVYSYFDRLFGDELLDESETEHSYYIFILVAAFVFWIFCKSQRFATYESDSFSALIPLYRTSRFSDIVRTFFWEYFSTARPILMGDNMIGEVNSMFNPPFSVTDEIMRTWYLPQIWHADNDDKLLPFYNWVEHMQYREDYVSTHLLLTNGLLGARRTDSFFKRNSLAWLRYGRIYRQLNKDIHLNYKRESLSKRKKESILRTFINKLYYRKLRRAQKKNLRTAFQTNATKRRAEYLKRLRRVRFKRRMKNLRFRVRYNKKRARKKRKFFFRTLLKYKYKSLLSKRKNFIFNIDRDRYLRHFSSAMNRGSFFRDWKFNKRRDLTFASTLLNLNRRAYRDSIRYYLFGPELVRLLNYKKTYKRLLGKKQKNSILRQYYRKTRGFRKLNRNRRIRRLLFSKHRKRLLNPHYLERLLLRLFSIRLKKSGNFVEIPTKYFNRDPDFDSVNKLRVALRSMSFHGFLLNSKHRITNSYSGIKRKRKFRSNNNTFSFYDGVYGRFLKDYIQYRFNVRSNYLRTIKKLPVLLSFVDSYNLNERMFFLDKMGLLPFIYRLMSEFMSEDFIFANHFSKNILKKDFHSLNMDTDLNGSFFRWYDFIYKNPFYSDSHLNYFNFFTKRDVVKTGKLHDVRFENTFYNNLMYNEFETYLRVMRRDNDWLHPYYLPWATFAELYDFIPYWLNFYLTGQFFENYIETEYSDEDSRKLVFYNLVKMVREAPKTQNFDFFIDYLKGKNLSELSNLKGVGNTWDYPVSKILTRTYTTPVIESLFTSLMNYTYKTDKFRPIPSQEDSFFYSDITSKKRNFGFFDLLPFVRPLYKGYSMRFFNEKGESLDVKPYSRAFRDFRSGNLNKHYYEEVFNLFRQYMDFHMSEGGYNRTKHLGSHLIIPFNELYPTDDMASAGSLQHRWYLGSISDDILSDERRNLMHHSAILWSYFLRNAQAIPEGDMPLILISMFGGLTNTSKVQAFGHVFYKDRERRNVNSDLFGDFGYEDLAYPPEEDSLGYTIALSLLSYFFEPLAVIYNYLGDKFIPAKYEDIIRPRGGNHSIRPAYFRNIFMNHHLSDFVSEEKAALQNLFPYLDRESDKSSYSALASTSFYFKRQSFKNNKFDKIVDYFKRKSYKRYMRNYAYKDDLFVKNSERKYLYDEESMYIPLRYFYGNEFAKSGYGILGLLFVYLIVYYLVWIPWMYCFFAINTYFDPEFGKDERTAEEIQLELEENEAEEMDDYTNLRKESEPADTAFRNAHVGSHLDVVSIVSSYYQNLIFDYTILIEPPYFFTMTEKELSFYGLSIFSMARNELFDLLNIKLYSDDLNFSLLDIVEISEYLYLLDGFRKPNPQFRSIYTEFLTVLTGFEVEEGDWREEYMHFADDDNFLNFFKNPKFFAQGVENNQYLSDGIIYRKNKVKKFKGTFNAQDRANLAAMQSVPDYFDDPFKATTFRNTVWFSTKLFVEGFKSLGIDLSVYQTNDPWLFVLHSERLSVNKYVFSELLALYPKGHCGHLERSPITTDSFQYKNGDMFICSYLRFFRSDSNYVFDDISNPSEQLFKVLRDIGRNFTKKDQKLNFTSTPNFSSYLSVHDSLIVQPFNFDGIASQEILLGLLYLFQQFVQESSNIVSVVGVKDFVLHQHSLELLEFYSSELLLTLDKYHGYTFSDWLFFFEESTDWIICLDHTKRVEIEDDYIPNSSDLEIMKQEEREEDLLTWSLWVQRSMKKRAERMRLKLWDDDFSKEEIDEYMKGKAYNHKPRWMYDESVEALILMVDEDELHREEPYFPDSDTYYSNYLTFYQNNSFVLSNSVSSSFFFKNLFLINSEISHKQAEFNLFHDIFLQFVSMQFVDIRFLLDPYAQHSITGYGLNRRAGQISSFQNNLYFSFKFNFFVNKHINRFLLDDFNRDVGSSFYPVELGFDNESEKNKFSFYYRVFKFLFKYLIYFLLFLLLFFVFLIII
jgi:hypothetical protein